MKLQIEGATRGNLRAREMRMRGSQGSLLLQLWVSSALLGSAAAEMKNDCDGALEEMQAVCADVDVDADEHCAAPSCATAIRGMVSRAKDCIADGVWPADTGESMQTLLTGCPEEKKKASKDAADAAERFKEATKHCDWQMRKMQEACANLDVEDDEHCISPKCLDRMDDMVGLAADCAKQGAWPEDMAASVTTLLDSCVESKNAATGRENRKKAEPTAKNEKKKKKNKDADADADAKAAAEAAAAAEADEAAADAAAAAAATGGKSGADCDSILSTMQEACAGVDVEADEHCGLPECVAAMEGMAGAVGAACEAAGDWPEDTAASVTELLDSCAVATGNADTSTDDAAAKCVAQLEKMQASCAGDPTTYSRSLYRESLLQL